MWNMAAYLLYLFVCFQGRMGFLLPPPDSGRTQTGLLCEQGGPPQSAEGRGRVWCAPRRCSLQLLRRLRRLQSRTSLPRSRRKMRKESQTSGRSPALLAGPYAVFFQCFSEFKTRRFWLKLKRRILFLFSALEVGCEWVFWWGFICGGVKCVWCGKSELGRLASNGFILIKWFKWPLWLIITQTVLVGNISWVAHSNSLLYVRLLIRWFTFLLFSYKKLTR